ncbi:MAG: hypothetical protein ACYC26_17150 [Phycisphaerales bacterium]
MMAQAAAIDPWGNVMFRRIFRHRRTAQVIIAMTLVTGAIIGGYAWWHRIPDVTSVLGPPPEVFHDPRLDTPLTITFNGVKFVDAITQIADRVHVPLHMDHRLDESSSKVRVFLHAHELPARVVLEHVLRAAPFGAMEERVDGLHVMDGFKLDEKPVIRHVNIQPMLDIIDRRNTEPEPGLLRRLWIWFNRQIGRDVDGSRGAWCVFFSPGSGGPPPSPVMQAMRELLEWDSAITPFYSITDHLTESGGMLTIPAIPQAQKNIYQALSEIYLGLAYGLDSRRLHPETDTRRRACAWMTTNDPALMEESQSFSDLMALAEHHGVSISILDESLERQGLPTANTKMELAPELRTPQAVIFTLQLRSIDIGWAADESGVITIASRTRLDDLHVTRTYEVSDLLEAMTDEQLRHAAEERIVSIADGGVFIVNVLEAAPLETPLSHWEQKHRQKLRNQDSLPVIIKNGMAWRNIQAVVLDTLLIVRAAPDVQDHVADFLSELRGKVK